MRAIELLKEIRDLGNRLSVVDQWPVQRKQIRAIIDKSTQAIAELEPETSEFTKQIRENIYKAKHVALFPNMYSVMDDALKSCDLLDQADAKIKGLEESVTKRALNYRKGKIKELEETIGRLEEVAFANITTEGFGWCKHCGALVVGEEGHKCDCCGGDADAFVVETELLRLRKIEQALKNKEK